jgi:dTDP-4-dehydrorhamnose reductase
MLAHAEQQREVRVVDQCGCPTYVGHLAVAMRELIELPYRTHHVGCRVARIASAELDRPAARPAFSVPRSEQPGTPRLPHWRDGLRACLERLR